jgi:hypothetical protein
MSVAEIRNKPLKLHELTEEHQGVRILHDPVRNKGTSFTDAERNSV